MVAKGAAELSSLLLGTHDPYPAEMVMQIVREADHFCFQCMFR